MSMVYSLPSVTGLARGRQSRPSESPNTAFFTIGVGNPGQELTLKFFDRGCQRRSTILYKCPTGMATRL